MLRLSHQHFEQTAAESNRVNRAASITTKPKRCGQDVASRPGRDNIDLFVTSSAARDCMPLLQHNLGVARRRTRRADGVGVDRSLPRDGVRALRTATTPTAPVRGCLATARGPAAVLGVPERGDGVQASHGGRRGAARRKDRSRAPCSTFHQCSAKTDPVSPESPQTRKRNHPAP